MWCRGTARRRAAVIACSFALILCPRLGQADHAAAFYPSFYPQEIRIDAVDPGTAAAGWSKSLVHAYVGEDPFANGPVPVDAGVVASLRSYLVLTFDAVDGRYAAGSGDAQSRCSAAKRILPALGREGYVFHPYPITPYHADYLEQFDLARQAQLRYADGRSVKSTLPLKIRAKGELAEAVVPREWKADAPGWDATLEEIDVGSLVRAGVSPFPVIPWIKQGWYQTHLLYQQRSVAGKAGLWAEHAYRRLVAGDYRTDIERINLQRALVSMLVAGCERVVVGYTVRREYFNAEYSNGVENVAVDSQTGMLSAIFPRSVKLKDFPWNGWLRVGVAARPTSAWNPVGGFTDPFGRLLWLTIADPALQLDPYGGSWIANRATVASPDDDSLPVILPASALAPEWGTGFLRPVGAGRVAHMRLRYSLVNSSFHDGTKASVADLLYPYIFTFHWGAAPSGSNSVRDPVVVESTALEREWLAGVEVIRTDTQVKDFGDDLKFSYQVPIVDVYLNHRSGDPWEAAAVAPPWATLPWEVLVLMEEAAQRGIAAFSTEEAQRRGIPWLDLVRDKDVGAQLAGLVEQFRAQAYRPEVLSQWVTEEEARQRWAALAQFHARYGHFLVTNGPYQLVSWTTDGVVLGVFRDLSYPLGVGAFDRYAIPLRAYVVRIRDHPDRLELSADVETVAREQRSYEIQRVPLGPRSEADERDEQPQCRYVIVGPGGNTVRAGEAMPGKTGAFVIDLSQLGPPGKYTIATALFIGGNRVDPEVKLIEHRVARASASHTTARPPRDEAAASQ